MSDTRPISHSPHESASAVSTLREVDRPNTQGAIPTVVLVTGMSGAGKTVALQALEDLRYQVLDNLPVAAVVWIIEHLRPVATSGSMGIALGLDIRSHGFCPQTLRTACTTLAASGYRVITLFMECDDQVIVQRFSQTRRRHPAAEDRTVADGIAIERALLGPVLAMADWVYDSTTSSVGSLRQWMRGIFGCPDQPYAVTLLSFGFRYGIPRHADWVLDVRFLRNPYYDPALRPYPGTEAAVGAMIAQDPGLAPFLEGTLALMLPLLPRYRAEGKSHMTFAFGCTGGRHRSVYVTMVCAQRLQAQGLEVHCMHRDVHQTTHEGAPS